MTDLHWYTLLEICLFEKPLCQQHNLIFLLFLSLRFSTAKVRPAVRFTGIQKRTQWSAFGKSACGHEWAHLKIQAVTEMAPSPGQTQYYKKCRSDAIAPFSQHLVSSTPAVSLNMIFNGLSLILPGFNNWSFGKTNRWLVQNSFGELLCVLPLSWRSLCGSWKSGRAGCRWAACPLSYDPARCRWHCWPQTSPFPCPCTVTPVPRALAAIAQTQKRRI